MSDEVDFDRPEPIADARLEALERLSALDQELELSHGATENPMIKAERCTPQTNATPGEGSEPREGTSEPQATLTNAEREALEVAVEYVGSAFQVEHHAATLRALLERVKQPQNH